MSVRTLWEPPHENIANALAVLTFCGHSFDADTGVNQRTMSQVDFAMISARLTRTLAQLHAAKQQFPNLYASLFHADKEEK